MDTPTPTIAVPDTNAFIHFRPFDELDWGDIAGVDGPILGIVWPVVRELDKLKSDPRTRDRARAVLSRIEELFATSDTAILRSGISARFFHASGLPQTMRERGLEWQMGDDIIIGTLLDMQRSQHSVVLATDDAGMRLRARAFGILVRPMPQESRLQGADPLLAENARLKRELEELKLAMPKLDVEFQEGGHTLRTVLPLLPNRGTPRDKEILAMRHLDLDQLPSIYGTVFARPTPREVEEYNTALDGFRTEYDRYVNQRAEFEEFPFLSARIALGVKNTGGRAAEMIKLSLSFPADVEVLTEDQLPTEPKAPVKPELPCRPFYVEDVSLGRNAQSMSVRYDRQPRGLQFLNKLVSIGRDASQFDISRLADGTSTVVAEISQISNFDETLLPSFFVRFKSKDAVKSFHFAYNLRSHTLPKLLPGRLHVRISRPGEHDDAT